MLLTGCGGGSGNRPASFASWQGQMQSYVTNQANGDMNALRDVHVTPGQPGFRAFSNDRPEKSKDIVGVLVGAQPIGDRLWYVYLVGEVDKEQVGLIRLAAISLANGQYVWRIGGAGGDESNASATYRAQREQAWKSQHTGDAKPPQGALNFPGVADQFTLSVAGEVITVRETASGAAWTLSLADQQVATKNMP
jgi:hypothetical protein